MDYAYAVERSRRGPARRTGGVVMPGQSATSHTLLGVKPGAVVQILGWDEDCDPALRDGVEGICGSPAADEDYEGVVDAVLLWWRDGDGDLVDGLLDSIGMLADDGAVWLLTPKPGRLGHVEVEEISDAAPTAGLRTTASIGVGRDWHATRLVPRH